MFAHVLLGWFLGLPFGTFLGILIMALLQICKHPDTTQLGVEG